MPIKDPDKRRQYLNEYKKRKRRERGLQKTGRTPSLTTPEAVQVSKDNRKLWEKEWRREYFTNSPQKRLLWAAKKRAKEKGLPFNLEETDIVVPTHCPYLGVELTTNARRGTDRKTVCSLDRIVPELGYVKGNVEVISHLANTMKQAATKEELILFAEALLRKFK